MVKYLPIPIIDTIDNLQEINLNKFSNSYQNDILSIIDFLKQYGNNLATFESYRREIERLVQWSLYIKNKSILKLKREDIQEYIEFCLDPPLSWIGTKRVSRFIKRGSIRTPNPRWRPFVVTVTKQDHKLGEKPNKKNYSLSQKAIREIFTVLSSFYNYLQLDEKVSMNPVALIRQKSRYIQKRQTKTPIKRLTDTQWQYCIQTAKEMANTDTQYERTLFILTALYMLYLRISELAASDRWTPQMKHFYQDSNQNWWFKTLGKGNKIRDIAVSDDMLQALKRYRVKNRKLTSLPSPNDSKPLLPKEKGNGAITSTRHIRLIVQHCFDKAVEKLRKDKLLDEANALELVTVHWLRHTGISDDINKRGRPIAHVRDDAGHSSSAITDRYNDIELLERHKSAKNKKIIDASND